MFGLVRFLLLHRFSNMQYQSWLDLAKFLLWKDGIQDGWLPSTKCFLRNGKHPNGFPLGSWDRYGSLVTGFHGSLKAISVDWKAFFFMCSKWRLDHLRLWSSVLGPLNSFCARRWLRSWPRTKSNTTKETVDFQRSSDHLSSVQAIKFLDETDKDPSGSLKTRWYQEKWQRTCEWFVLFRSFNVLSKWNAWFCPREFYRP